MIDELEETPLPELVPESEPSEWLAEAEEAPAEPNAAEDPQRD
jgi:hypothetical protein